MINVLIIEDQRMMRETMETYIKQTEGYHLSGSFSAASDAERFCILNPVDLVLMDVCTENDESGFVATKAIKSRFPENQSYHCHLHAGCRIPESCKGGRR